MTESPSNSLIHIRDAAVYLQFSLWPTDGTKVSAKTPFTNNFWNKQYTYLYESRFSFMYLNWVDYYKLAFYLNINKKNYILNL